MLTAVSKQAHTVIDTDERRRRCCAEGVADALAAPGGPVEHRMADRPPVLPNTSVDVRPNRSESPRTPATVDDAGRGAVALLAQARGPLIWAGGGVATGRRRADRAGGGTGRRLLTSNSGRGAVPEDHPLCIGNYAHHPRRAGAARRGRPAAVARVPTSGPTRPPTTACRVPAAHVQVDLDPAAIGRVYPAKAGVVADIATRSCAPLLDAADARRRRPGPGGARVTAVRTRSAASSAPASATTPSCATPACRASRGFAVIARDVTIASSSWGNRLLAMYDPRDQRLPPRRRHRAGPGHGHRCGAGRRDPSHPGARRRRRPGRALR